MKPVTFNGCFGWLHMSASAQGADTAIIICQSLLKDAMAAYVSIRTLADATAALGMPTLRFDYPGCGDSLEPTAEANNDFWPIWQHSIGDAIDWVRRTTGVRQVVLCGLQIGAALASVVAARRTDIAGLVLIDPMIDGRTYVRAMTFESELLYGKTRAPNEDLLLHELRLSPKTLGDISASDLRRVALPAGMKVALFTRGESRALAELTQVWRDAGVTVSHPQWAGLDTLFASKLIEEAPIADFGNVLGWLRQEMHAEARPLPPVALQPALLHPPGAVETPMNFGPDGKLFGILAEPDNRAADRVVIVGNIGHDPHYGPGRQSVSLARRLAASGVACLRLDFAGLGDSKAPPGKEDVRAHVFEHDRSPELRYAVDALEAKGYRRFGLQGTCSAAYHAFHGALADPRISSLMMVNIPLFTLPTTDALGHLEQRWQSPLHYALKIFNRSSWMHLLRGDRDLGLALRTQFLHAPARVLRRLESMARHRGLLPNRSFAWRSMAALSKRGVRTLFILSDGDAEREAFAHEFGQSGEQLAAFGKSELKIVPGMDHGLMKARERDIAERLITDFAKAG